MPGPIASSQTVRRYLSYLILVGLFLTFRGYRSREVDQAYRLPILFHQQDPGLFSDDPFVRSFDQFNPHRGYLALLDGTSRAVGISTALAVLFLLTALITVAGIDRLASAVWSDRSRRVGLVAAALVFMTMAGNIGTNHLFEPMLLDRLIAFGLGWLALARAIESPATSIASSSLAIAIAGLIHPSLGLQLAMFLGVTRLVWWRFEGGGARTLGAIVMLAVAVAPGLALNLRDSRLLLEGLSPADVYLLSAELQSPQHMLPHLWRMPQWLAWGCFPILALCAMGRLNSDDALATMPAARRRLLIALGVNLAGLALAWVGIERWHVLRLTLFQPFRMATVARGLCVVLVAGRVQALWERGDRIGRLRAVLIGVGLVGDWMLVVATAFEVAMTLRDAFKLDRPGLVASWACPGLRAALSREA